MELKKYKLGDVADIVNGATPSTHNSENYDGSIIWITPKDLSGQKQKIIRRGQRNISEIGFNNCSAQMIPPYNILMSSRAPIGLLAINENECCTNQGFKNLVLDKSICDTDYMYYYLQFHMKEIEALGSGTTFKEISKSALQGIEIRLPDLEKQRDIAKCLSDLDRKIELNKQINDNLEAMAKQLYDYWFVQFDFPNEEGKPYKSSGGAMVWNEKLKREIPKGWNFCFLENLLIIRNGRDHKHLADGIYPVYGSGGEIRKVSEYLYDGESVLMPRKGSLNNIMYVNEAFWTVDTMFYSEMKQSNCAKYIFYTIKDIDFTRWDSGTGVPSMTSSTLYSIKLVKPQSEILKKFDEVISPLFEHMKHISEQNSFLTKQRDKLLPLLMNGQASVNSD